MEENTVGKAIESVLIYGPSGSGKTTQAEELAKFVREEMGPDKKVRLISASGGGWSTIQSSIDLGWIDPLWLPDSQHPFEALDRLSKGWWISGGTPGAPLGLTAPENQSDWDQVGGIMFEGLKEIADLLMRNAVTREANKEIKIATQGVAASFKDGATTYGAPAMAHYGAIQNHIEMCVANSKSLGGKYCVWTSLELKAVDDNTRLPIYGPDVIGRAKTSIAPAWFDDCLHLHFMPVAGKPAVRRMYLQTHYEQDGIPYSAKNRGHRLAPLPEFLEGKNLSLGIFLKSIKESHKKAMEILEGK